MKKSKIILSGVLLSLCISNIQAYSIEYFNGFDPVPTTVYCYIGFGDATVNAISRACSTWNNAGQGTLVTKEKSSHSETDYKVDDKNCITKGTRGSNTYVMQTMPSVDDKTTQYEVDIDINMSYPWGTSGSANLYDIQNSITHELGHLLGLGDCYNTSSTMYAYTKLGETKKRDLATDDINGLAYIYK